MAAPSHVTCKRPYLEKIPWTIWHVNNFTIHGCLIVSSRAQWTTTQRKQS